MSMDFVTGLSVFSYWKSKTYDFILVIIDWLTKIVHFEPVKFIINTSGLAKVIINMIVEYYCLPTRLSVTAA